MVWGLAMDVGKSAPFCISVLLHSEVERYCPYCVRVGWKSWLGGWVTGSLMGSRLGNLLRMSIALVPTQTDLW
jgi:hypothetical protein